MVGSGESRKPVKFPSAVDTQVRMKTHCRSCWKGSAHAPSMGNITSLLQNASYVGDGEDATDVFDALVRRQVPEALKNSVGHVGVPFADVLAAGAQSVGAIFDTIGAEIAAGSTFREAFPRWRYWLAVHFSCFPLFTVYASVAARGGVQLRDQCSSFLVCTSSSRTSLQPQRAVMQS